LGEMFGHEGLHRLDLDDEHILDEDIREILSERRPIPVADPQRILGSPCRCSRCRRPFS
jgi:hypothetical protein